jgi:hypothetical protein
LICLTPNPGGYRQEKVYAMNKLVYHYTTLDALCSIIQRDKIVLRATMYKHLNDPFEKIWSQEFIQSQIKKEIADTNLSYGIVDNLVDRHPYIISFCDIPDYRNMWRLYCNDGFGICIGFDSILLTQIAEKNILTDTKHKQDFFEHVYYCSRKEITKAFKYWEDKRVFEINKTDNIDNLYIMSAFIKCDDFNIEHEVRYARLRENLNVKLKYDSTTEKISTETKEDVSDVKYRMRYNEKVPYLEIAFPSDIIRKVIVGYGYNKFSDVKECIEQILSINSTLYNVDIEVSTLNKTTTNL